MKRVIVASTMSSGLSEFFSGRGYRQAKEFLYNQIDTMLQDADVYLEEGTLEENCSPEGIVNNYIKYYDPSDGRFDEYSRNLAYVFGEFIDEAPRNVIQSLFTEIYNDVVQNEYPDFSELVALIQ